MLKKTFTVSDMPSADRPRERLKRYGAETLSSQDLLAVILGRGSAGKPVLDLATELICKFGGLRGISEASIEQLCQVSGIGLAKASQLKAAFDLIRRMQQVEAEERPERPVHKAQDIFQLMLPECKGKKAEYFFVLTLNSRGQVTGHELVSKGSLTSTVVHPREVFKAAINRCAASVILVHNHPSGDPEPSDDDIALTRRLVEAGKLLGISVQDHVIISEKGFASLKARNVV